ncbi:ubiquitin carboxyl-terminal hydrolase 47-like [Mizuhopecten yessoensis]|uniref:Ubiquitin carboxyl-terminal hydrolase 47 n=1 Tax=Mizuhopecten yessoensis TaxID=6573 RepID=A0A210PMG0_MIZYE|nr:ubiquitin carboxyl-terminal hydrolase 47-like [Mizuhopecten yessoensis]OWF37661.1 Ubiquitin carboxyl-terminal hydrolase 47 [Mizuhopecten yessoensis]
MVTGENTQVVPIENVCVADEQKFLCVVRDMVDVNCAAIKHTFNLPASTSVARLISDLAEKFAYLAETISIHYEKQIGSETEEIQLEHYLNRSLSDICVAGVRRHDFTICDREGVTAKKVEASPPQQYIATCATEAEADTAGSSDVVASSSGYYTGGASGTSSGDVYTFSTYSDSSYSYSAAVMKSDTGYVGLVNQAMTCYLNSLLQTLFMTPEFRNALYRWEYDGAHKESEKNIPYQLQKLYLQLQTSQKRAAETTDLTKSFGWDSSEVWQQHDVQELCRVMFDALELKWRNTKQANLINHLYQGKMKDYVKCLECGNESARVDSYLDIPLVIRPFGATTAYGSVEEALNAFVQPETLDGSNQYFCEKCNKKCDAHKGLKFQSFPYLLTLQLKRFDFDYSTMHRIKLNDRMTFQEVLNLNHMVDHKNKDEEDMMSSTVGGKVSDGPLEDSSDEGIDVGAESELGASAIQSPSDDQQSLSSEAAANTKNAKESECTGPYVYELFSIMIHSGSAAGGHYYAYIKSFVDGQWYSFNDQHVSKIGYDEITKIYGGASVSRGYYSATYSSSTNAYMLMYRQIDKQRNADFIQPDNFPEHISQQLQRLKDKDEAEQRQKELDKSTCKIKTFCYHPVLKKKQEQRLEVHKDKTLAEAMEMVYKLFDLRSALPLDCCRLVKYDEYQDTLERSFEGEEDVPIGQLLGGVKQTYNFDLLLETKRPEQQFHEYKPGGVTVKVFVVDMDLETIQEPISVRAYNPQSVAEFKEIVSEVLDVPVTNMRCVLERFHNDLRYLWMPHKTLKAEGFFKSNKVYIEYSGSEDPSTEHFVNSRFYNLLDRHQNTIRIHVSLPSVSDVHEFIKISRRHSHLMERAISGGSATKSLENLAGDVVKSKYTGGHDPLEIDEGISDRGSDSEVDFRVKSLTLKQSKSDPSIYHNCCQVDQQYVPPGPISGQVRTLSLTEPGSEARACSPIMGQSIETGPSTRLSPTVSEGRTSSPVNGQSIETGPSTRLSPTMSEGRTSSPVNGQSNSSQDTSTSAEFSLNTNFSSVAEFDCGREAVEHSNSDSEQVEPPSPGERTISDIDFKKEHGDDVCGATENWDSETLDVNQSDETPDVMVVHEENIRRYFCVVSQEEDILTKQRHLTVRVDKRITLGAFKKELEPYVQTTVDNFKVYRVYSNNQEFESIRLSETMSFFEDGKLNIKLGRALKPGEYRVKVYQLQINEAEPSKFLIDTIFAKGMSVLESKKLIIPEIKEQCNIDLPLDRCRLRKKTWKNPGTVYTDAQVYEDDLPIFANWEVFLQILDGPELMVSTSQLSIFVRRWKPSAFEFGPFEEIILCQQTLEELKEKLSEVSGIAQENVEYAKGRGTFPCDISLLEVHTDLDWNPYVTTLNSWPLYICDDGNVLYYRDKNEKLMKLSDDRRKELQNKENARLSRSTGKSTYSPRKEKALKIYTDDPPVKQSQDLD